MTRKIGISLRDELYEWASREVEDGRAVSVSALVAQGLEILQARGQLEALVADLTEDLGEPDEATQARVDDALRAADEAYRQRLERKAAQVG